jgi:putative transmembrane protein PGPGW
VIRLLIAVLLFVTLSVVGMSIATAVIVRLPLTYFSESHSRRVDGGDTLRLWVTRILKNALGVAVVVFGIVLSLPGIPGPGILTIVLGIMLMDFPGKRRFERWLISRPKVFAAVNRLRSRRGKPAFTIEDQP